ncbi:(2Fe-2S)-binding protein [Kitasatospora sp. LaBMicrA B282]|uniref:(2Fe-2S)-binding protein n=1 Tax=Kitasatospora sp. LaBMicrA B282 TaxID=3420949 RepID=UPI003D0CD89C
MTQTTPGAATAQRVAALGPFFAVETHGSTEPVDPWRPLAELRDDPAVLRERIAGVRGYLAATGRQAPEAVEERVAASVTHLGLVARLISPAFGVAVLDGALFRYGLGDSRWQPALGGLFPLSLPDREPEPVADPAELADRLAVELLGGLVGELSEAVAEFDVSPHILRGNTASAVNGAAAAVARSVPELGGRAHELAARLLDHSPLRGAGTMAADGTGFRRRSCCLVYRAAPGRAGGLCGDCVLASPPTARPARR